MSPANPERSRSTEDRLQAVEDRLEIYNLIASHPPIVDSLSHELMSTMFTLDGVQERPPLGSIAMHNRDSTMEAAMQGAMRDAARMGLAHLTTLPYIKLGKNTAVAFSYVAVTVRDPTAEAVAVPAHGTGQGHRLFLIAANRWDLARTDGSWKIRRRKLIMCDGSEAPRELGRSVLDAVLVD
jgi:hypothetical protein